MSTTGRQQKHSTDGCRAKYSIAVFWTFLTFGRLVRRALSLNWSGGNPNAQSYLRLHLYLWQIDVLVDSHT